MVRIGRSWTGGHGKAGELCLGWVRHGAVEQVWLVQAGKARYGRSVTFSHGAARQGMARHETVNNQNEMGVTNGSL